MTICNLDGVNPLRQEFMENECEALPGIAYPGVRDNRSTINTKTGYDDDDEVYVPRPLHFIPQQTWSAFNQLV